METRQFPWFSYLQVFFRWRKFFVITLFGVCVVAAIVSLILPKYYQSTATILPPLTTSGIEAMIPDELRGLAGGFFGENVEANTYLAILNSRSLREQLIEEFNLDSVYKFTEPYHIEDLLQKVDKSVSVVFDGEKPMEVSAIDRSPERSAAMVNFMVDELDRMYQQINNRRAFFNRQFLGKRVEETRATLEGYEDSLRAFQEEHQAISLTDQAQAAIEVASELVAKRMNLDIQIGVLESSVQPDHPKLRMLTEERNELEDQFRQLTGSSDKGEDRDLPFPGFDKLPKLGMEYIRLFREVEIQSKLLEFLVPQYEQARIQEVRDTPTVTVLDRGRVPTKRIKPQRKKLVLITAFLAFIVLTVFVFIVEYFWNIRKTDESTYKSLEEMTKQIRREIPLLKKK
jgi:tyrosine-protein kinase Etk/Wzc